MDCFKIRLPEDTTLVGTTASGEPTQVFPGEYLVHRLEPKVPSTGFALLRFVGADAAGRDVHVPVHARADPRREVARLLCRAEALESEGL